LVQVSPAAPTLSAWDRAICPVEFAVSTTPLLVLYTVKAKLAPSSGDFTVIVLFSIGMTAFPGVPLNVMEACAADDRGLFN
jgi:hypothetical protein